MQSLRRMRLHHALPLYFVLCDQTVGFGIARPSGPPAAIDFPSELIATELTAFFRVPSNNNSTPVVESQILTVRSQLSVASRSPSGLNARLDTGLEYPIRRVNALPEATSHMAELALPQASRFPSG